MAADERRLPYNQSKGISDLIWRIVNGRFPPIDLLYEMHKMVQDSASTILGENSRLSGGFTWYKYKKSTSHQYRDTKKRSRKVPTPQYFKGYFLT